MKKYFFVFSLAILASNGLSAQTAADSVKATVKQLFEAMLEANPAKLQDCFTDSAILQTIVKAKDGKVVVRTDAVSQFMKSIASLPPKAADERISFETVKVDDNLAIVWTPYQFFFNGQFSHCGANSFQLVRINGRWKIQYLIDTRRKSGCIQ